MNRDRIWMMIGPYFLRCDKPIHMILSYMIPWSPPFSFDFSVYYISLSLEDRLKSKSYGIFKVTGH